jgi:hypothetical protein
LTEATPGICLRQIYRHFGLIAISLLLLIFARPVSDFTLRTAAQLHQPEHYIKAVIPDPDANQQGDQTMRRFFPHPALSVAIFLLWMALNNASSLAHGVWL